MKSAVSGTAEIAEHFFNTAEGITLGPGENYDLVMFMAETTIWISTVNTPISMTSTGTFRTALSISARVAERVEKTLEKCLAKRLHLSSGVRATSLSRNSLVGRPLSFLFVLTNDQNLLGLRRRFC